MLSTRKQRSIAAGSPSARATPLATATREVLGVSAEPEQ
jgi:hypothetical protein